MTLELLDKILHLILDIGAISAFYSAFMAMLTLRVEIQLIRRALERLAGGSADSEWSLSKVLTEAKCSLAPKDFRP